LTDDAVPGTLRMLYAFDAETGNLTLVSPNGGVQGVTAISDDGSHAYYVQENPAGGADLKMFTTSNMQSRPVAYLEGLGSEIGALLWLGHSPAAEVSADGEHLLFQANTNLTSYDSHGAVELYDYDASDLTLDCVSCDPNVTGPRGASLGGSLDSFYLADFPDARNLSSSGKQVVFDTPDALVARDLNQAVDVYRWKNGQVSLLSDGRSDSGSYFFGASNDGDDIFFSSKSPLLSQDYDNGDVDIYVARIGGGFATTSQLPICTGESCQGGIEGGPVNGPSVATNAPQASRGKARHGVSHKKRRHKLRHSRHKRQGQGVRGNSKGPVSK
jgi:hypothetical protein